MKLDTKNAAALDLPRGKSDYIVFDQDLVQLRIAAEAEPRSSAQVVDRSIPRQWGAEEPNKKWDFRNFYKIGEGRRKKRKLEKS